MYRYARRWYAGRYAGRLGGRGWWRRHGFGGWSADSATLAHAIHKKRMRKRAAQILRNAGFTVVPATAGVILPVDIVNDYRDNLGQRAFPDILGMPNGILGKFEGEVVHTGGGSYIWRLFQWEPYILPG